MSPAILQNNEKFYLININQKIYCSVGYTPRNALSALTLSTEALIKIEIREEDLFVSNLVCKNREKKKSSMNNFKVKKRGLIFQR